MLFKQWATAPYPCRRFRRCVKWKVAGGTGSFVLQGCPLILDLLIWLGPCAVTERRKKHCMHLWWKRLAAFKPPPSVPGRQLPLNMCSYAFFNTSVLRSPHLNAQIEALEREAQSAQAQARHAVAEAKREAQEALSRWVAMVFLRCFASFLLQMREAHPNWLTGYIRRSVRPIDC